MRAAVVLAGLSALSSCAYMGAEPDVSARISRDDVRQIRKLIADVTAEPIRAISPNSTEENAPGAIRKQATRIGAAGTPSPITVYERIDLVSVHTGFPGRKSGRSYALQKTGATWKIIGEGRWLE